MPVGPVQEIPVGATEMSLVLSIPEEVVVGPGWPRWANLIWRPTRTGYSRTAFWMDPISDPQSATEEDSDYDMEYHIDSETALQNGW